MAAGHAEAALGLPWLAGCFALAIHVADEATHDFLAWYNPRALRIRQRLGGLPFPPTFTFPIWLAGLISGVLLLFALTPPAFSGRPWIRPLAYALGTIHAGNGLFHLIGSAMARRPLPGVLSAPLLLGAGIWLLYATSTLP